MANPTGGVVTGGSATIASGGTTETITQSTQQAIINWQQFSIANSEATKFFVPNASSATLNRVLGGNPSAIYGSLSSNGQLILINPSGIVVGPSGRIDTAGFIGSTLAISDSDFLKGGNLHFTGDGSAGAVDNEGTIHAETGDVYLIGSQVANGGTITAPRGTAGLAAGQNIVFEQAGDLNLYVQATPLTATRATGVTNSGTIHAAAAVLKAAGGNAYALAINNSGQIAATGFRKVHGQVLLTADGGNIDNSGTIVAREANGNGGTIVLNGYGTASKGTVLSSGKLIATGVQAGAKGGTVEVLGNQVGITGFGLVDVSGAAGGGTALLGGDEHGANPAIPDADQTYLGSNATIKADAFALGNGGKVVLWGNETTQAYGRISARGGTQGGNGGSVETSGKTLDAQTAPDIAAPKGQGGIWLLDPSDIYISDSTTTTSGFSAPFTITSGGEYNLSQDDLSAVLQVGNVTLDASQPTGSGGGNGTITWNDTLGEVFAPSLSGATTLTLNGPGGVSINNVTMAPTGAALNLVLNSSITGAGPVQVNDSSITTNGGSSTANGNGRLGALNGVSISNSTINAGGGNINLTGNAGEPVIYGGEGGGGGSGGGSGGNAGGGEGGSFQSSPAGGNGVYIGGGESFTDLIETSGSGNITVTATAGQGVTTPSAILAFNMVGNYGSNQIKVVNGTATVLGTVTGVANGTDEDGATLIGVEVGSGANIAASGTGSVKLTGDVSGAQSIVSGSNFSFADGIEIGSEAAVSVQGGTLTLQGTGTSIDASEYDGINRVFSAGVHLDNSASISAGTNGKINVTGTINSGAVGNGADLVGTLITLDATVTGGTGSQVSLTGITTGSNVISSATGNSNVGLEIDNPVVLVETDAVFEQAVIAKPSMTTVSIGTGGGLTLKGTSGSIDGSLDSNQDNQAGTAGIDIDGNSQITVGLGTSVTMTGTGGAATVTSDPTSGFTAITGGVVIDGVPLTFDGGNVVKITGTGGSADNGYNVAGNDSNPATSVGVEFDESSTALVSLGTGGSLTVYGYGGAVSTVNASASAVGDTFGGSTGIGVHNDIEAQGNTTISLQGYGGDITAGSSLDGVSFGVEMGDDSHAVTLSTQTGALTINGQAGSSPNLGVGVALHGFNGNQLLIETTSGNLTLTGLGGAGNSGPGSFTGFFEPNYGVAGLDGVEIKTTANGTVSITGTAGAGEEDADGVGFSTTSDTSADSDPVDPDINATGAVMINALSGGGIALASTTVEAPSLRIGNSTSGESGIAVTSGPVRLIGAMFTLTGPLTVYGSGGGTGNLLTNAIEINGSTLNAGTGNILMNASGGTVNTVGLEVENSRIETAGSGTLNLTGSVTTPRTGLDVVGVDLYASNLSTATGKLSVTGTVSGAQQGSLSGLQIEGGEVTSTTGAISLYGFVTGSSSATSGSIHAVDLTSGAQIQTVSGAIAAVGLIEVGSDKVDLLGLQGDGASLTATGNGGSVTLVGNTGGATTTDASNIGLAFDGSISTQNGGGISLTGTSGGATFDSATSGSLFTQGAADTYGITVSADLSTMGTAPISITGYGGTIVDHTTSATLLQSTGTDFYNAGEGSRTVSTVDGMITITGTGGTSDNAGFGVSLVGYSGAAYDVTSTTGKIVVKGTAGLSPATESPDSSSSYEPNIGVVIADNVSLSTGGTIAITGQGIALAPGQYTNGSGLAIKIDSFGGYEDGSLYDTNRTTPQLSAGGTISLTSLEGTVETDVETQIQGNAISGNFIVTTPDSSDESLLYNLAGTVTLEGYGGFVLDTESALTVQTESSNVDSIEINDTAGIHLGSLTASYLQLNASTGAISQSGAVLANELEIGSSASVALMNKGNNISILDGISSTGAVSIYTDPGLELTGSVQSGGSLLLESIGGGITLDPGAQVTDNGPGNVTLVTDQGFVNNSTAGAGALAASNGVYYIYSAGPTSTSLGGLHPAFTQYNTVYPAGSTQSGNGLFYASTGTSTGGGTSTKGTTTTTGGGTLLPPVVAAPHTPPPTYTNPYTPPPTDYTGGTGGISQTGSQSGGLAFASGSGGQVGAGDTAQLNDGQMNNVSNPHAAGELNDALSGPVHESLVDALMSVGAFVDTETYGDTSDDEKKKKHSDEQVIGDGGVVEIGNGTVQQIPLSSAPKPLQDALGSGVMRGLQPAGH